MKIVHVCSVTSRANGIKSVLKELSVEQQKNGAHVRVISLLPGEDSFIHIDSVRSFYKEICNNTPDIVIFHSVYYMLYVQFAIILALKKIPYAIELHGALSQENYKVSHTKKVIANILFFNRFIKNARSIIYLNNNEYDKSVVKNINPKSVIIPNGCSHVSNLKRPSFDGSPIKVVYIGRIERVHKGLDILLEAIDAIITSDCVNDVRFIFYGNAHESEQIWFKEQVSNRSSVVEYRGPVYGNDKDVAMRNANIFILTSRSEGMPMGVLEALSYGLPCILTPETNLGKEVENAGAGWIPSLDPQFISRTIKKAVVDYRQNGEYYRENALKLAERYNWTDIAKNSIRLYKTMI